MSVNLDQNARINSGFSRQYNVSIQPSTLAGGPLSKVLDLQVLRAVRGYFTPNTTAVASFTSGALGAGACALIYDNNGNPIRLGDNEVCVYAVIQAADVVTTAAGANLHPCTATYSGTTITPGAQFTSPTTTFDALTAASFAEAVPAATAPATLPGDNNYLAVQTVATAAGANKITVNSQMSITILTLNAGTADN